MYRSSCYLQLLHVHGEDVLLLWRGRNFGEGGGMMNSLKVPTTCDLVGSVQHVDQIASCELGTLVAVTDAGFSGSIVASAGQRWAQRLEVCDGSLLLNLSHDMRAQDRQILLISSRIHDAMDCGRKKF